MELKSFDLKKIGIIVAGFVGVVIAFAALVTTGIGSVKRLYGQLKDEQKQILIIKDNIQTLKKVDLAVVSKTDQVFVAMPNKPLVPLLITNLKTVSEGNFIINNIKSEAATPLDQVNGINLVCEGSVDNFLKGIEVVEKLQDYAPLTSIQELFMKTTGADDYQATITVSTFWSELPVELPRLDEPVKDLSSEEMQLVNTISQLKRPSSSNLDPQVPVDRINPFQ